jgi:hypothetical protein
MPVTGATATLSWNKIYRIIGATGKARYKDTASSWLEIDVLKTIKTFKLQKYTAYRHSARFWLTARCRPETEVVTCGTLCSTAAIDGEAKDRLVDGFSQERLDKNPDRYNENPGSIKKPSENPTQETGTKKKK